MPRAKESTSIPIVTAEARKVLDEVSEHAHRIGSEIKRLSESDLKAFVYLFQKSRDMDDPVHRAVIAVAERELDRMDRHRTGRGAWFALVQALKPDPLGEAYGEIKVLASAECGTRPEAVSMARQLLAEHVADLNESTQIEAKVLCELDDEAEGLKA
jgi:hypothetical protein